MMVTIDVLIAVGFNLTCTFALWKAWHSMSKRTPEMLPKLYLASSAIRLMGAVVVMLVYCVVVRDAALIRTFSFIFIACYLLMLAFDAIYFAKISKQKDK